jgi:cell division septation protein DedD
MLPIESSSSEADTRPLANPDQEKLARADQEKKRLSRIYIATVLAAGLLIAAGYVGTRIFAGKSHPPATPLVARSNHVSPNAPKPTSELSQPAPDAPPADVQPAEPQHYATPRSGEIYLQVAALSTPIVPKYLSELRDSKLEPIVAPGPRPGIARILIGPFPDSESLESARQRLRTLGAAPFVRVY